MMDFMTRLYSLEGENVEITVSHRLFGNQKVNCPLHIVEDEERLGFYVKDEAKYVWKKELYDYGFKNGVYYFADDLLSIELKAV